MLDYQKIRTKLNTSCQLKKILAASEMRQYAVVESVSSLFQFLMINYFSPPYPAWFVFLRYRIEVIIQMRRLKVFDY
jgi:hypothetical protein